MAARRARRKKAAQVYASLQSVSSDGSENGPSLTSTSESMKAQSNSTSTPSSSSSNDMVSFWNQLQAKDVKSTTSSKSSPVTVKTVTTNHSHQEDGLKSPSGSSSSCNCLLNDSPKLGGCAEPSLVGRGCFARNCWLRMLHSSEVPVKTATLPHPVDDRADHHLSSTYSPSVSTTSLPGKRTSQTSIANSWSFKAEDGEKVVEFEGQLSKPQMLGQSGGLGAENDGDGKQGPVVHNSNSPVAVASDPTAHRRAVMMAKFSSLERRKNGGAPSLYSSTSPSTGGLFGEPKSRKSGERESSLLPDPSPGVLGYAPSSSSYHSI